MYLKIHKTPGEENILAICDAELMGKTLTSDFCNDIIIDRGFYGDELATEEEVKKALHEATNANIIGKKVCKIAADEGLIDLECCIMFEDIPHAQIYGV
jgi:Uncharacterized conserved protein